MKSEKEGKVMHTERHHPAVKLPELKPGNGPAIYEAYSKQPDPPEELIAAGAHILSEWLDDAAPLNERRYRAPAEAMLKFAFLYRTILLADRLAEVQASRTVGAGRHADLIERLEKGERKYLYTEDGDSVLGWTNDIPRMEATMREAAAALRLALAPSGSDGGKGGETNEQEHASPLEPGREGWRLVPVEPTDAMKRAGWDARKSTSYQDGSGANHWGDVSSVYWAMIAAAPSVREG